MSGWFSTEAKPEEATTGPSIQDRAIAAKDQAGTFIGEQTTAVTKAATDTADAAKQKATETAQYVQDRAADAVEYTKGPAAAKEEAAPGIFQQAGGQVMGAAVGAKDAVMNTLGMGGDAAAEKK
ncbi:hypothetical protein QYE76_050568 [Lolium multiflorum]|uniref:Cold responsive protein n=1 Tax=Lolium multiflorum TaxID=4521 RepID=A0AAD8WHE8_LOLMU|nr:hypothetical protein QYE76_050568 [Lolium multiflorum]